MAYITGPYRTIQDMSRIIDNNEFLSTLSRIGYHGALAIERETGSSRMQGHPEYCFSFTANFSLRI